MDSQNTHLHFSTASCWVQSRFLSAEGSQPGRFHGFSPSGYRWEALIHEQASSKAAKQLRLSNELSDVLEFPVKGIFQDVSAVLNCWYEQRVVFFNCPKTLPLSHFCALVLLGKLFSVVGFLMPTLSFKRSALQGSTVADAEWFSSTDFSLELRQLAPPETESSLHFQNQICCI